MNLNVFAQKVGLLEAKQGNVETWVWPTTDQYTYNLIVNDWVEGILPILFDNPDYKNGTVIQAGGNCGVYPLFYTQFFKRVYTFEPDPINFFCLVNNCQMNEISKFNCALGDKPGNVNIIIRDQKNLGMNMVQSTNEINVPVVAIDSFGFQDVKLIQLDLEGYEPQALLGAVETLKKWKPDLILECAANYQEVMKVLQPLGYVMIKQITRLDCFFKYQPNDMVVTI